MDETLFLATADKALEHLQDALEAANDDLDCSRSGNVLTIELESGAQVVVNIPLGECVINQWLRAAKNAKSLGFRIKLAFCARDNLVLQQVCRA